MNLKKGLICSLLAIATLLSCTSALAADVPGKAAIWLERMIVEGNYLVECWDETGKETYYLSYGGSVYVPLRTAAEWMGKDIAKSPDGKTFTLSGSKAPVYRIDGETEENCFGLSGEALSNKLKEPVSITILSGAQLVVDGTAAALTDAAGKPVNVIAWNNSPYIPVRTAAQLLGMEVKYATRDEGRHAHIYLRSPLTDEQLQACMKYTETLEPLFYQANNVFHRTNMKKMKDMDMQDAQNILSQIQTIAQTLKDTPKPDCRYLDPLYQKMLPKANETLAACERIQQMVQNSQNANDILSSIYEVGDGTGGPAFLCLDTASNILRLREMTTQAP